jgi:type IV secretion system protein VirB8
MHDAQASAGLAGRRTASDQSAPRQGDAMIHKQAYFASALNWDSQQRADLERRVALYGRVAWTCGILCALSVTSLTVLLPLKTFVPAVIRVDNATGAYDVQAPGELANVGLERDQKILLSDVARYVLAREGFTRGEAEANYKTAYLMSCGPVRAEWEAFFNPEVNPHSPVRTMAPTDAERVEIQSVTFLPTDQPELRVAQVRFEKTVSRGVAPTMRTRHIATLTVRYDRANVPGQIRDLYVNAFGFCALNYRTDAEGMPQALVGSGGARAARGPSPVATAPGTDPSSGETR